MEQVLFCGTIKSYTQYRCYDFWNKNILIYLLNDNVDSSSLNTLCDR